jgi:hypothetical protein
VTDCGLYSTQAVWLAKFTPAAFTPGTDWSIDSTLTAQAAQVISSTGNVSFMIF